MKKLISFTVFILAAFMLQGCMHKVSDSIPKDGIMTQDQVTFPNPSDIWIDGPSYPSLEALRKVSVGMHKDEIRGLLGYPHFAEGLYGVLEWDYLFNLKQKAKDPDEICQYKIIYDKNYTARSFFWKPESCADIVSGKKVTESNFELSSDLLFDFGKSNLKPDGKKEISKIVSQLEKSKVENIEILGYTDPIGSDNANLALSQNRANSVKNEFVALGIPYSKISAIGLGEENQVKICDQNIKRSKLIECLAPNRRVVITVNAGR